MYLLDLKVLSRAAAILRRARVGFVPNRKRLRELDQRAYAILFAVGAAVSKDDYSEAFREAVISKPSARELADICNALNRSAKPVTDKHSRIKATQEIYAKAAAELDRLLALPPGGRNWLCGYRNTLMIALMAARPLRLKNFTALKLGRDFLRNGSGWLIAIPGEKVKNRQPLEFEVIESLVPYVEAYLQNIRPRLMKNAGPSEHLWVAWEKPDISQREVYECFIRGTRRLLGAPINPHLFRDCAATSLSLVSTAAARAAAPLLGHQHLPRPSAIMSGRSSSRPAVRSTP